MARRLDLLLRFIGMVVFAVVGWQVGDYIAVRSGAADALTVHYLRPALALSVGGAGLGLLLTPWLTIRPALWVRKRIRQIPARNLFMGTIGLAVGLVISLPVAFTMSFRSWPGSSFFRKPEQKGHIVISLRLLE